ncbi:farnesyl diphosphate synthase [Thecamonas trahens ATCC 50062]|uniref:Farnesyl diphosphate synthase n=1 Tax=Thecamonas trahens ATCC 50062 TaxID=461836 RepID=A0A0L0D3B5_THETB|nr:farnesyl diphosphate synthase [Thecamonas trahens ATCC 50062]KNC46661.1 farnesyl diphosphate synthase [Thecamonas trahens ATCC 50062]|eukprot:XP_013760434.1 farnesyl diphosphate synthase [Thecamonas trahens ATCC 50062]
MGAAMAGVARGLASGAKPSAGRAQFKGVFQQLRTELVDELGASYEVPTELQEYLDYMAQYNVPGGKLNRGMAVVDTVAGVKGAPLERAEYFKAAALGWCVEFMQAFLLVADDIMDNSLTRRGVPCWYQSPHIGMDAVNDALILESFIYIILKKHFRNSPHYVSLMETFHDVTYRTELGQLLDLKTAPADDVDLSRFTMAKYNQIVKYKTGYYSFFLPVSLGMTLANVNEPQAFADAERILLDMGRYFQIQDDVLDCFGDPAVSGKIGTDIQDNKCTWLVVTALERASPDQRRALENNYGRSDAFFVEAVKSIYRDLELEAEFRAYEAAAVAELEADISGFDHFDARVFSDLLAKIANRTK